MPNHREAPVHLRHDPKSGRKAPITDDLLLSAINATGGLGKHDSSTGLYKVFSLKGMAEDEAESYRLSLYRCALWMTKNGKAGQGISVSVRKSKHIDGTHSLTCSVFDKVAGKAYINSKPQEERAYSPHKYRGHSNYNS